MCSPSVAAPFAAGAGATASGSARREGRGSERSSAERRASPSRGSRLAKASGGSVGRREEAARERAVAAMGLMMTGRAAAARGS